MLTGLLVAASVLAAPSGSAPKAAPTLLDFASPAVLKGAGDSGLSASVIADASGNPVGAEVRFPGGDAWRGLVLRVPAEIPRADWNGWEGVVLDLENRESAEVRVAFSIRNAADTWEDGKIAHFAVGIPANTRVSWPVRLFHLRYTLGWDWPALPWGGRTAAWGRADPGAITEVWIGIEDQKGPVRLGLYRLALSTPVASTGWIDRWGQRGNLEWPLKVHKDADLKSADRREMDALTAAKRAPAFDTWHAWAKGPLRQATGFFRVEEVDGRWWLVAPNGRLFFMTGIDCVGPWSSPRVDDRVRAAHAWWPPEKGLLAGAWGFWWDGKYYPKGGPSFYRANLIRKWGPESLDDKGLRRAMSRLLAWQFSSIGNWSDDRMFRMKKLAYVTVGPPTWDVNTPRATEKLHDPFHPAFAAEARAAAAKLAGFKDDPWCIGHFIDNEVDWSNVAPMVLAAEPGLMARARWVETLRRKYGELGRLDLAWGTSATTWETLRFPRREFATATAWADAAAFRGEFADAWYRIWGEAVRAADPNHLVLGSRLHGGNRPDEVVAACGRWMDVVSFNHYDEEPTREEFDRYYALAKKPFLIGEYGFNSLDDGLLTAAVPVASREERGAGYRFYTEHLAALPYFVGGHYFQWIDEPVTGRGDGETSYNGFVKVTDLPDPFLVEAAKATNPRVCEIHAGLIAPIERRPKR